MPRTRTRVLSRTQPRDPDFPPARMAQLRRDIRTKIAKAIAVREQVARRNERHAEGAIAQQKAPGLVAEGSACSDDDDED